MITQITDSGNIRFGEDYYSGRINAYITAYGTGYDFCRLYKAGDGLILIYNSSAVFAGDIEDDAELEGFISLCRPETVESPVEVSPEGYEKRRRIMFEVTPRAAKDPEMIKQADLGAMYGIISEAFDYTEHDLWYTDMSHRIRHGVTRAYMYGGCTCAAVDFIRGDKAYISQTATLEAMRGRGYAGELLGHIAHELGKSGVRCFLWAYEELEDFYRGKGYPPCGEDIVYIKGQET